jgi:hypothetical protein
MHFLALILTVGEEHEDHREQGCAGQAQLPVHLGPVASALMDTEDAPPRFD